MLSAGNGVGPEKTLVPELVVLSAGNGVGAEKTLVRDGVIAAVEEDGVDGLGSPEEDGVDGSEPCALVNTIASAGKFKNQNSIPPEPLNRNSRKTRSTN